MAVAPVINYIYSSDFNAAREFNLKQNFFRKVFDHINFEMFLFLMEKKLSSILVIQ